MSKLYCFVLLLSLLTYSSFRTYSEASEFAGENIPADFRIYSIGKGGALIFPSYINVQRVDHLGFEYEWDLGDSRVSGLKFKSDESLNKVWIVGEDKNGVEVFEGFNSDVKYLTLAKTMLDLRNKKNKTKGSTKQNNKTKQQNKGHKTKEQNKGVSDGLN